VSIFFRLMSHGLTKTLQRFHSTLGLHEWTKCIWNDPSDALLCMDALHFLQFGVQASPSMYIIEQACEDQQKAVGTGMRTMLVLCSYLCSAAIRLLEEGISKSLVIQSFRRAVALCRHHQVSTTFPLLSVIPLGQPQQLFQNFLVEDRGAAADSVCIATQCVLDVANLLTTHSIPCDRNNVEVTKVIGPLSSASFTCFGSAFPCSVCPHALKKLARSDALTEHVHHLYRFPCLRIMVATGDISPSGDGAAMIADSLRVAEIHVVITTSPPSRIMSDAFDGAGILLISGTADQRCDRLCAALGCIPMWADDLRTGVVEEDSIAFAVVDIFQFTQKKGGRHHGKGEAASPQIRHYAVICPFNDGLPRIHACATAFLCAPTEDLHRRLRVTFFNTLCKVCNILAENKVVPGAGFTEAMWAALLHEYVDHVEKGQRVVEFTAEVGPYDVREGPGMRAVAGCLERCLLTCLVNTGAPNAADILPDRLQAFRAHIRKTEIPADLLAQCPELSSVQVSLVGQHIPAPPLISNRDDNESYPQSMRSEDIPHWEDVQGRYEALSRAVELCSTLILTQFVTL